MYIKYLAKLLTIIFISLIFFSCVTIKVYECKHETTEIESDSTFEWDTNAILFNDSIDFGATIPYIDTILDFKHTDTRLIRGNKFYYPFDTSPYYTDSITRIKRIF